jgi:hypothetical protein
MCRAMMVSEVPASECQLRGSCDPKITAATMPTRSPSPRPGAGKVDHRLIDILVIAVCAVIAQGRRMKL